MWAQPHSPEASCKIPARSCSSDVDLNALTADRLNASAGAGVQGDIDLTLLNITTALPGAHKSVIVSGAGGLTYGGHLNAPVSAIATYSISQPNADDLQLNYTINFSPNFGFDKHELGLSRSAFGDYLANIQSAGSNAAFAPLIQSIFAIPDGPTLANFYQHISPGTYAPIEFSTLESNEQFAASMLSCDSMQKSCEWGGINRIASNQSATENTVGIASLGSGFDYGFQAGVGYGGMSIGGAVSYDHHALSTGQEVMSGAGYTLQGGLLVSHRDSRGTALGFGVTYGAENDMMQRSVAYPGPLVTAFGRVQSEIVGTHLHLSRSFLKKYVTFAPYADIGVTTINTEGINETGAGFLNAHTTAHSDSFTAAQTGVSIGVNHPAGRTTVAPSLELGFTQYLGATQTIVTGQLEGAPAGVQPYTLPSRFDRTSFHIAPTISASRPGRLSVKPRGRLPVLESCARRDHLDHARAEALTTLFY